MPRLLTRLVFLLVLVAGATSAEARRINRTYRYYLDPNRAEEILAGIMIEPRLYDDRWLGIIGEKRNDKYEVQRGDTLWDISARELGNARLWRKIWEVNQYLANPHEITPGQLLAWYNERPGGAINAIPFVRLVPQGRGFTDLDDDAFLNSNFRYKLRPRIVIADDEMIVGEVRGSYRESEWLGIDEAVYLEFVAPEKVKRGERYNVIRFERVLFSKRGEKRKLGVLAHVVAEVQISGFGDQLVRANVLKMSGVLERGDAITPILAPVDLETPYFNPAPDITVSVLAGEIAEQKTFRADELIILDRGLEDGIKEGLTFRVYVDGDPVSKNLEDVDPSYKAELQVLSSSRLASVAYITKTKLPVALGDLAIPAQAFEDREPSPKRDVRAIEID